MKMVRNLLILLGAVAVALAACSAPAPRAPGGAHPDARAHNRPSTCS